jgi:hypothetical protein
MRLTFIVTIDPVKGLELLDTSIHSLNLQTRKNFDVVFYNQTRLGEAELFARLRVRPAFDYRFFSIEPQHFLGDYPLWDLFAFHRRLLEADLLGDYFMSVHMEEFFDVDYVEKVTGVLEATGFDILLGNLSRTRFDAGEIAGILTTTTARDFDDHLRARGVKRASHWAFQLHGGRLRVLRRNWRRFVGFGLRTRLTPTREGFTKLPDHHEDVYLMSREFALRYDWFLSGRRMYFEDIHLCDVPGVCELGRELVRLTDFPNYFNQARVYHLRHPRFYYQLQDPDFTDALLAARADDPILQSLQEAIRMYRAGSVGLSEALLYTRQNAAGTGTQNLNYRHHMEVLEKARAGAASDPVRSRRSSA